MKALNDWHPAVLFYYFVVILGLTMFNMHPILLVISFAGSLILSLLIHKKALKQTAIWLLPFMFIAACINPLITHKGEIIILYINSQPITIEAIVYGFAMSFMLSAVVFWFISFNVLMTSDKFLYIFGRISPAIALLLTLTMRFIPLFFLQIKKIITAQKTVGMDATSGSLKHRVLAAARIISILISWALENAIETADSMKARGYGLKNRSTFSLFAFTKNDFVITSVITVLLFVQVSCSILGWHRFDYYPTFSIIVWDFPLITVICSYVLLVILPIYSEVQEALKWRSLKSIN